jgi:hypothetical protein
VVRRTEEGLGLEWCEQAPDILDAVARMASSGHSLAIVSSADASDIADVAETPE